MARHRRPPNFSLQFDVPWQSKPPIKRRNRERIMPLTGEIAIPLAVDEARQAAELSSSAINGIVRIMQSNGGIFDDREFERTADRAAAFRVGRPLDRRELRQAQYHRDPLPGVRLHDPRIGPQQRRALVDLRRKIRPRQ
jgi:hypothetical protein